MVTRNIVPKYISPFAVHCQPCIQFFSIKANLVFTPFAPVRESDKEIKCKYRGRRSCWLSTLEQEKRSSRLKISVVFRLLVVFSHNLAFGGIREIINDSSKQ